MPVQQWLRVNTWGEDQLCNCVHLKQLSIYKLPPMNPMLKTNTLALQVPLRGRKNAVV